MLAERTSIRARYFRPRVNKFQRTIWPVGIKMGPPSEVPEVDEYGGPERRQRARVSVKCPVTVHGKDASGQRIKAPAVLENLSVSGLCVNSAHLVQPGQRLFAVIHFAAVLGSEPAVARVAI